MSNRFRLLSSPLIMAALFFAFVVPADAQSVVYHLHNEASTTSGFKQLKTAGPDVAQTALQTAALQGAATGEKQIAQFDSAAGVPGTAGTIPTGATVTATVWMRKTANLGTMFPRIKARLNSSTGTSLCTATGTTALTTTLTAYTLSCTTNANVTLTASDRWYVWAGVNLTVGSSSGAFRGELGVEGTLNGPADSLVTLATALPSPSITSLSPTAGPVGTTVTITGNNFRDQQLSSTVKFFNNRTATVSTWSNTSIVVAVPANSTTGNVTVTVAGTTSAGMPYSVGTVPVITQLSPNAGLPGDGVIITGTGFGATKGSSTVKFNGLTAATTSWSATSIAATVPAGANTGNVVVTVASVPSAGTLFTVPTLTSIAVTPVDLLLPLKSRQRYQAVGTFSNGLVRDMTTSVTWSSTSPSVAQVDTAGVTMAVGKGTSTLVATSGSVSASTTLNVTSPSFTRVGMMSTSRTYHTATLLSDGRVLVAGGQTQASGLSGAVALATAEIYDPVTGEFTPTGSMSTARINHTATLLTNGMVLIVGGYKYQPTFQSPANAELYNPNTGTFVPAGSMSAGHYFHTSTLLADGRVLIAGGRYTTSEGGGDSPNEIYDPATSSFSVTGAMVSARFSHAATRLADGRVLVSGGSNADVTASSEIFDPGTGTFAATGSMVYARWSHNMGLLSSGAVLVVGGLSSCALTCPAELFDPTTGSWSLTADVNTKGGEATAILGDGSMVIIGGQDNTINLPYAETYSPATLTFTAAGAMLRARISAQATRLADGTVLVTGGRDSGPTLASAEVFVPSDVATPATTLRISPSNPNIVVDQELQFTVVDSIGRTRDDAQWSLGGSGATLETDPIVKLTATAPGVVTLSATVGGVTTETQVTIVSETTVVAGQSLWTSTAATGLPVKQVVRATPTVSGPDLYVISGNTGRTVIQALALDGRQLWQESVAAAVNNNSTPDGLGGLILTFPNDCTSGRPMKIIAVDGPTGEWRWDVQAASACTVEAPQFALRQDQAVAVVSPGNTSGLPGLTILDGTTGQPIVTPPIPPSSFTQSNGTVLQGYSRVGPPMVDVDGSVIMEYEQRLVAYPPRVEQTGIFLLKVAPSGATSTTQLTSVTTDTNLFPGRIIPDGQGGLIASWTFSPAGGTLDANPLRGAHLTSTGTVTEFNLPIQPPQLLTENNVPIAVAMALGDSGTVFATYGAQVASFGLDGGTLWTAQPPAAKVDIVATDDQNGVMTKTTDGGGVQTLVSFNSSGGQSVSPLPAMGTSVEQIEGEFWTGVTGSQVSFYANAPIAPSSIWPFWNQRRTNQAITKASIEVKCRSISSDPNNPWWQKIAFRIAQHCYIVTREQNGTVSTIEGGEVNGRPSGTLRVGVLAGDSVGPNRPSDWSYYWNPTFPWQSDADAQSRIPCLKQKAVQMHNAHLAYYYQGPNSNRAVVELMEACGITSLYNLLPGRVIGFRVPFTPSWQ